MQNLIIIFTVILFIGCGASKNVSNSNHSSAELTKFCQMISGQYNSEAHHKRDTNYYHISLAIFPIWKERSDGHWFYVEQAMAPKYLHKPYRQRIYQIKQGVGDTIISVIYTFAEPLQYAGAHKNKSIMDKLTFDKIENKLGCEVYLTPYQNGFKGGTKGFSCPSNLKGASYATTEVTMMPNQLLSWDRGYDKRRKYIWGAEKGGYVFDKIATY